jgi:hypothetical protein
MNEPTADQVKYIIDLFYGKSREQVQSVLNTGFLSALFKVDVTKIDKHEFMLVCGFLVVPQLSEKFWLEVGGVVRNFYLAYMPSFKNLEELINTMTRCGYNIPERECLEAFEKRFPKSDGKSVCLAKVSEVGGYPALEWYPGEIWRYHFRNSFSHVDECRWLVEVVEEKSKQPEEKGEWKKVVLSSDCSRYQSTGRKFPDVLDEVSHGEGIPCGTEIEISKVVLLMYGGNRCKFFPYRTKKGEEGFIRSDVIR